jgi:hypothetical protein
MNVTDPCRPAGIFRRGPLVLLAAVACGTSPSPDPSPSPNPESPPPSIQDFRVDPASTPVGERAQLVAVFSGTSAEIEGLGPVQSGQAVQTGVLSRSTAFTLRVRRAGQEAVAQLTVAVHYRDRIRPLPDSPVGRQAHVAMVLPDGSALLMGGNTSEAINTPDLDTTQRFDVATEGLTAGPELALSARDREFTVPVPLQGGAFLLAGGGINAGVGLGIHPGALTQRFDPATGQFKRVGDLKTLRSGDAAATLLADGRVLMTGGGLGGSPSSETYDPASGEWTQGEDMVVGRREHTATLLADGRVLLAGGIVCCASNGEEYSAAAELYDPSTRKFQVTGHLTLRRALHRATLLNDGRVLISGGFGGADPADGDFALAASEVFDPATGKFSALGTFQIERLDHSAVLLTDGRVLVVGGARSAEQFNLAVPDTELFDPSTGQWAPGPRLDPARRNATATLLGNGRVLLFGGADAQGFPRPNVFLFE